MGSRNSSSLFSQYSFHIAVKQNNLEAVQRYIANGIDLNFSLDRISPAFGKDGGTPLFDAISLNYKAIVQVLIKAGAAVNYIDHLGRSPLHKAAFHGREEIAKLLIESGADVNKKDNKMNTPLHISTKSSLLHNNLGIIKELVQAGADVNAINQYGVIPLHHAVLGGSGEITKTLLMAKSDVDQVDCFGKTPLYWAMETVKSYQRHQMFRVVLPAIKALIQAKCDPLNLASYLHKYNIIPSNCDEEFYEWYKRSLPETLEQQCKNTIVKHLIDNSKNETLSHEALRLKIEAMPLPSKLHKFLSRCQFTEFPCVLKSCIAH